MSRTPTSESAQRTRDRILDSALDLFNERGSAAVTTNLIAVRAGISPGNLYYWFRGKDDILRELYARLVAAHEALWQSQADDPAHLTPDELLARLNDAVALTGEYAFFARDLFGLLHADPVLAAEYVAVRGRRIAAFTLLAHRWRGQGVLRSLTDQEIADVVQTIWVVAESWLAFDTLDGSAIAPEHGSRLLRAVLGPHLADQATSR